MDLKRNYTKHISDAVNPNQGVGGKDEVWVSNFQTKLLIENGLKSDHDLLELGCGTGRLLIGLSHHLASKASYLGIDLVDQLVGLTEDRIKSLSLNKKTFKAKKMKHELDYPTKVKFDYICAFSVYTHMEPEDIFNSLKLLLKSAQKNTMALVTFLPLEFEFGKVNFLQEAEKSIQDRYRVVRNVSMTQSQAMQIAHWAGWGTINSFWAELDNPYENGQIRTNQSWLLLTPIQ